MIQNNNNYRKIGFCFSVFFVMLLWLPAKNYAQGTESQGYIINPAAAYTVQAESTTYTPLVGGTAVSKVVADEGVSNALPIGFTFMLGCAEYTNLYACSNGYLTFAPLSSAPAAYQDCPALAPLWVDLQGDNQAKSSFSYLTTGTAPNRVFTAEWKNYKWAYNATGAVISFQVKIYEGTNVVEYIYQQEATAIQGSNKAAIGINSRAALPDTQASGAQIWLQDATANPQTSTTMVSPIAVRPQTGQLYRFILNNNECIVYGHTIINPTGGKKSMGPDYDGIMIDLSGTGNMQIRRANKGQIYLNTKYIDYGTSNPYAVPGTTNGLVLSVGDTPFVGGTLDPNSSSTRTKLTMVSSTRQSLIESPPGHFEDVIVMSATKNSLTYLLEVKYTYNYPDSNFLIDYKVTIPPGNREQVKLAHGWDSFLQGGDNGPGFVKGDWDSATGRVKPNFIMGTKKTPSYEAFQYLGGIPWDGYYTGYYGFLNGDLGSITATKPYMTFSNYIDPTVSTDNGFGISMDFGSTPGTFISNNALVFACTAGDNAPTLTSTPVKPCAGTSFNLNSYVTSTPPAGAVLKWTDNAGTAVADPTNVSAAGTYKVSYYSGVYDCNSATASLTITLDNSCAVCYKPAVTTGTAVAPKTIISTLDRTSSPRNWSDPRTGSLILESTNRGFVLTRMASPETAITSPVEGMIVYDTVNNVIKLYNGSTWHIMTQQGCPD